MEEMKKEDYYKIDILTSTGFDIRIVIDKIFNDLKNNKNKEVLRTEAERLFKEKGVRDHDWGNFYIGFLEGSKDRE